MKNVCKITGRLKGDLLLSGEAWKTVLHGKRTVEDPDRYLLRAAVVFSARESSF